MYEGVHVFRKFTILVRLPNNFLYEEFMAIGMDIINGVQWSDHQIKTLNIPTTQGERLQWAWEEFS